MEYNVGKDDAEKIKQELVDLNQQFLIVAGRYKTSLTEFYLANTTENQSMVNENKRQLQKIYADTFLLSSKINNDILENNKNIQSLDKYLDELKKLVTKENSILQNVENSGQAAKPRKEYIRDTMQQDYYMDGFYTLAILGGIYFIIEYYKDNVGK